MRCFERENRYHKYGKILYYTPPLQPPPLFFKGKNHKLEKKRTQYISPKIGANIGKFPSAPNYTKVLKTSWSR